MSNSRASELPTDLLKGEIKNKTVNIECLERQLKAKTEDYSKL